MSTNVWNPLGSVPISSLTEARLQLHWASQIVASFGNALIERRADDSQSNLRWEAELHTLCGHPSSEGLRVGLRLSDLTLLLLDQHLKVKSECGLPGHTLQEGFGWLTETYTAITGNNPRQPFTLREYEMPPHPVQQNGTFSVERPASFQEYEHWFANAHIVLHELSDNWQQASPVRCWPHHFDIATLVILDPDKNSEEARSVGCGMSPGDTTYPEPYWYVNLWPYPDQSKLPYLEVGNWHTEGWIGAILTATELVEGRSVASQGQGVQEFFHKTTQACFSLLGAHP